MFCEKNISKLYDRFSFFGLELSPANVCWSTRHVLKTSLVVFSIRVFCLPWRHLAKCLEYLQDVFKTSWKIKNFMLKTSWSHILKTPSKNVLKTSWSHFLKTSLEDVFKTPWRQTKCLLEISVSNKPKSASNKSISHKPKILHICLYTDRKTKELICYSKNVRKTTKKNNNKITKKIWIIP